MLKIVRRAFSFLDWAKSHPRDPPPGDWLDIEFDQLIDAFDEWDQRVRQAITPDGKVAPGTVTADSLDPAFFHDLARKIAKIGDELLENAKNEAKRAESAARVALLAQTHATDASIRAISAENAVLPLKTDIFAAIAAVSTPKATPRADTPDPESFQGHSEAWADASRAWAEHMPDTIPGLVLAEMDITGDHWSSRWWANRADNAFGRLTDLYLGAWPDPPTQNLEGGPITVGSIYYNTQTGQMYVWDGDSWNSMTQPARAGIASLWYAAADGQTAFPFATTDLNGHNYALSIDATEGIDAHVNGVKVMPQELTEGDWTLNAATSTVTFLRPLRAGDIVSFDILMSNDKLGPGAVNSWSLALTEAKDGTRTTFTLTMETLGGPAVTVAKNEELIVSLDGVIQEPGVSYNASGSSISFAQAPAADSWVFVTWFRSEGGAGVLSGETVDWADITGKPATFPPTLPIAQSGVTNLVTDLAGKAPTVHTHAYSSLTSIPSTFAPSAHGHPQSEVTNLVADLGLKAPLASPAFTGSPTAPTPTAGDEDTSIATTAFVQTAVDSATGAGLFGYFDYTFNLSAYTPPPIAGNFRMNNATQSAATHIYVHEQTATSNNAALMLAQIAVNDKLLIQNKADATKWQRYTVTAAADMGVYWDFTVTWVDGASALTNARTGIIVQKPAAVGISDAPNDGKPYVRKSLGWDDFTDDMALKLNSSAYTAADVLTKVKTVDGATSGLDADMLDAQEGTYYLARGNHTGTQSADTLTDGTTNKAFLATERTKLTGIATGATANSADATLLARANHTGSQLASTISDFNTAADARVALKITNKLTVASSAPGSPAVNDVWIDTT